MNNTRSQLLSLIDTRANKIEVLRNRIVCIDALAFLRSLPAQSVHCIVTSPPYYGLRDYGIEGQIGLEDSPQVYVQRLVELFREARRVLRDDGVMWLNLGDSYVSSTTGVGTTKSTRSGGKMTQTVGGMRPDKTGFGLPPKNLIGIPWRVAFALQDDGWYLRSDIIWHKPNPMPESVTDRPTKAHEYVFLLAKSERYFYDSDAIREPHSEAWYSRAQYPLKETKYSKHQHHGEGYGVAEHPVINEAGRNRRTVWTIPTEATPFAHFATFPQKLIEPMILAGCPAQVCSVCGAGYVRQVKRESHYEKRQARDQPNGKPPMVDSTGWKPPIITDNGFKPICSCNAPIIPGIVLDPFMGSGTTALVARRWARDFIGSDCNQEYVTMARDRLDMPYMVDMFAAGF